jgi:hypothetical protein
MDAVVQTGTWTHNIAWQLEVMPGNKILVPGYEPTSGLSSKTLGAYLAREGVSTPLVDLQTALAAIPGSFVKFGFNFNRGGFRQKWFVLPPLSPSCPCNKYPDYYKILKSLATAELPVEEKFDMCDINGMGYCPHPEFNLAAPVEPDPYQPEGSFPAGGGVLPPLPAWQNGDYQGGVG